MRKLKASFISLIPQSFDSILNSSILGRGIKAEVLETEVIQARDYARDKHKTTDDSPYGGGPGQLLKVDVFASAIKDVCEKNKKLTNRKVILVDPAAKLFTQKDAKRLSKSDHLVFVCGRYEGIDARIYDYVDESFSVGDSVLIGGELSSMVIFDSIAGLDLLISIVVVCTLYYRVSAFAISAIQGAELVNVKRE